MTRLPISLVMFTKDNAESIYLPIESVKDVVSEIIVVDTGSFDRTIEIAKDYGARVYEVGFTDFGNIRTLAIHLANEKWILSLDSDEIINYAEVQLLDVLISFSHVDAWGLPRRRWNNLAMDTDNQIELEAYPDYQYRFIQNKKYLHYVNRVHERLNGAIVTQQANDGPHIEHFQDVFKTGQKLQIRNNLYKELYNQDICDGVKHTTPPIATIDQRKKQ